MVLIGRCRIRARAVFGLGTEHKGECDVAGVEAAAVRLVVRVHPYGYLTCIWHATCITKADKKTECCTVC